MVVIDKAVGVEPTEMVHLRLLSFGKPNSLFAENIASSPALISSDKSVKTSVAFVALYEWPAWV